MLLQTFNAGQLPILGPQSAIRSVPPLNVIRAGNVSDEFVAAIHTVTAYLPPWTLCAIEDHNIRVMAVRRLTDIQPDANPSYRGFYCADDRTALIPEWSLNAASRLWQRVPVNSVKYTSAHEIFHGIDHLLSDTFPANVSYSCDLSKPYLHSYRADHLHIHTEGTEWGYLRHCLQADGGAGVRESFAEVSINNCGLIHPARKDMRQFFPRCLEDIRAVGQRMHAHYTPNLPLFTPPPPGLITGTDARF